MTREELTNFSEIKPITANGSYRLSPGGRASVCGIIVAWLSVAIPPTGTLTFSVDGDHGATPGTINLGSGQRVLVCNTPLPFVDIDVAGLPAGASIMIYLR